MKDELTKDELCALKSEAGWIKTKWRKKYKDKLIQKGYMDKSGKILKKGIDTLATLNGTQQTKQESSRKAFIEAAITSLKEAQKRQSSG